MQGLHHLHLRKRVTQKTCEPYPARTPGLRLLDRVMIGVALLSPLALLPQALRIFTDQDVAGLSLITWILLTGVNVLWSLYAFIHRDRPLLIASVLIALLDLAIVVGILKYS